MTKLSPHFDSREWACEGQEPPEGFVYWAKRLAREYLEPLRARYGPVTILSGWRSASHNAEVGGAPASFHMRRAGRRGAAADFVCARGTPRDWYAFLDARAAPGLGLYAGHVHVDNRRDRARW